MSHQHPSIPATTPRPPGVPTTPGFSTGSPSSPNTAWPALSSSKSAPVVLANGSISTSTTDEGAIRQKMVENDLGVRDEDTLTSLAA